MDKPLRVGFIKMTLRRGFIFVALPQNNAARGLFVMQRHGKRAPGFAVHVETKLMDCGKCVIDRHIVFDTDLSVNKMTLYKHFFLMGLADEIGFWLVEIIALSRRTNNEKPILLICQHSPK